MCGDVLLTAIARRRCRHCVDTDLYLPDCAGDATKLCHCDRLQVVACRWSGVDDKFTVLIVMPLGKMRSVKWF